MLLYLSIYIIKKKRKIMYKKGKKNCKKIMLRKGTN